ncbi:MAG: T9SS type A sorting domain-containing protein [Candidatus Kapaibacterium sp.]
MNNQNINMGTPPLPKQPQLRGNSVRAKRFATHCGPVAPMYGTANTQGLVRSAVAKTNVLLTLCCVVFVLCLVVTTTQLKAQTLKRSVISNAGRYAQSDSMKMNSTVGQSAIGRVSNAQQLHNIGFWYGVKSLFGLPNGSSLVMIPSVVADIGVNVHIPLILLQSKDLQRVKAKTFEAVIRYNPHVLSSTQYQCNRSNDSCRITVTGKLGTNDTLITLPFLTKLGNDVYSPLVIESFRWIEAPKADISVQHGRIDFTGICHEGDTTRLVYTVKPTAFLNAFPNPAVSSTTVNIQLGEVGETTLALVDVHGRVATQLYSEQNARIGEHVIQADVSNVASGEYFLILRTPTQILSHQFIVKK